MPQQRDRQVLRVLGVPRTEDAVDDAPHQVPEHAPHHSRPPDRRPPPAEQIIPPGADSAGGQHGDHARSDTTDAIAARYGFLSEATWDPATVNTRRLALLRSDPATAPDGRGVLVIDEHGDRKWGRKTAHVGRQYLANLGKTDSGVVSVTSLWADEAVYWPVDYEPYTPKHQ